MSSNSLSFAAAGAFKRALRQGAADVRLATYHAKRSQARKASGRSLSTSEVENARQARAGAFRWKRSSRTPGFGLANWSRFEQRTGIHLTPTQRELFARVRRAHRHGAGVMLSIAEWAELVGCCEKSVKTAFSWLETYRLVVRVPQFDELALTCRDGKRRRNRQVANVYLLGPLGREIFAPSKVRTCRSRSEKTSPPKAFSSSNNQRRKHLSYAEVTGRSNHPLRQLFTAASSSGEKVPPSAATESGAAGASQGRGAAPAGTPPRPGESAHEVAFGEVEAPTVGVSPGGIADYVRRKCPAVRELVGLAPLAEEEVAERSAEARRRVELTAANERWLQEQYDHDQELAQMAKARRERKG